MEPMISGIDMLKSAVPSLYAIQWAMVTIVTVLGFYLCGSSLYKIALTKKGQGPTEKGLYLSFLSGVTLLSVQSFAMMASATLLKGRYYGPDVWGEQVLLPGDTLASSLQVLTIFINFLGWWNIIKAGYELHAGPKRPQSFGWGKKMLFHLGTGVIGLNFFVFINMLSMTFGGDAVGTQYFDFRNNT